MADLKLDIQNIDKIKTLIELLNKHKHDLSSELIEQLNKCADCDVFEYDDRYFVSQGVHGCHVILDDMTHNQVMSINPILKRAKILGGKDYYFDKCKVIHEETGKMVLEI